MTPSQTDALKWLSDRGGDAVFNKAGVAMAHGENAPFRRSTWNALRDLGLVEFYNPASRGHGRLRLVRRAA